MLLGGSIPAIALIAALSAAIREQVYRSSFYFEGRRSQQCGALVGYIELIALGYEQPRPLDL